MSLIPSLCPTNSEASVIMSVSNKSSKTNILDERESKSQEPLSTEDIVVQTTPKITMDLDLDDMITEEYTKSYNQLVDTISSLDLVELKEENVSFVVHDNDVHHVEPNAYPLKEDEIRKEVVETVDILKRRGTNDNKVLINMITNNFKFINGREPNLNELSNILHKIKSKFLTDFNQIELQNTNNNNKYQEETVDDIISLLPVTTTLHFDDEKIDNEKIKDVVRKSVKKLFEVSPTTHNINTDNELPEIEVNTNEKETYQNVFNSPVYKPDLEHNDSNTNSESFENFEDLKLFSRILKNFERQNQRKPTIEERNDIYKIITKYSDLIPQNFKNDTNTIE